VAAKTRAGARVAVAQRGRTNWWPAQRLIRTMGAQAVSPLRGSTKTLVGVLCVLAAVLAIGLRRRAASAARQREAPAGVTIDKQPVNFAERSFAPNAPPADLPPMSPGEQAVCDSNFISNVSVGGQPEPLDSTHEIVTITRVAVTLQLNVTIWLPDGATQHVIDHEEGHRQISEFYYASADKLAAQIAATYIGKKEVLSGADLEAASNIWLQQMGSEITDEYGRELNPAPTQLRYDLLTDYSRNGEVAPDAVTQVLKDVVVASSAPAGNAGN
jgi:hypothetical protein